MTAQIRRLLERFEADPADRVAFETLEEHFFLHGEWATLVELYERHLAASEAARPAAERARLLYRLGQALEEGLGESERALDCHRRALALDPGFTPALRRARLGSAAAGHLEAALELARREASALPRTEERAALLCELGETALRGERPDVAAGAFEAALAERPDDGRALVGHAIALERMGRPQGAAKAWERAAGSVDPPERADAVRALGRLLTGPLADPERAFEVYEAAHRAEPHEPEWLERAGERQEDGAVHLALAEAAGRLGDGRGRAGHLEHAMELGAETPHRADLGLERAPGREADASGLERLRRAVVERPSDAGALESLSAALATTEHHRERAELLERRAALASATPRERIELLLELGELQETQLDDAEAASDTFQMAFALDPTRPETVAALRRLLAKLDRHDELAAVLEHAASHAQAPQRAAWLCAAGEVHLDGRRDPAAARERFSAANEIDPGCARALAGLARAAAAAGDEAALRRALAREAEVCEDPTRLATVADELARLGEALGCVEEALPAARRWVSLAPDDRAAHELLVRLLEQGGLTDELATTLERLDACLEGSERGTNQRRLAWLHAAEGRSERAIAAWRAALSHDPCDAASLEALVEALAEARRDEELLAVVEAARVAGNPALDAPATAIRRAEALERAGAVQEAAGLYRALRAADRASDAASRGLERTARALGDAEGLATALAERSVGTVDAAERDGLELELAEVLERLGRCDEARALLVRLAEEASSPSLSDTAKGRLEALLERTEDFAALVDRLERRLEGAPRETASRLHARIAELAQDRLADPTRARRHLEWALALAPGEDAWWRRLAALLDPEAQPADRLAALEGELACPALAAGGPAAPRALALHLEAGRLAHDLLDDARRAATHWEAALALEPGHEEAGERLVAALEAQARFDEAAALLRARLARLEETGGDEEAERRTSLRLRLADCLSDRLDRGDEAIRVLEDALREADALEPVAERLARLLHDARRFDELAALCETASEAAPVGIERARWARRLGDACRAAGDGARATRAYEQALDHFPEDEGIRRALADLLRERGDAAGLARLLAGELARPGADERAIRLELADLFEGPLGARPRALEHLARVVALDPTDRAIRERAVSLARALGCEGEAVALLRRCAADPRLGGERAVLWRRCGDALAGSLGRPVEAVEVWRAALRLEPEQPEVRSRLRETLESLGRREEALALLRDEWAAAAPAERAQLAAHGVDLAAQGGDPRALAIWTGRLVADVRDDAEVWLAIARLRGEPHAREHALSEALRCLAGPGTIGLRRDLERERARLLEHGLHLPGAAAEALESARRLDPRHPDVLAELDRLYAVLRQPRERLAILIERLAVAPPAWRAALARDAAACAETLGDPARAAELWLEAAAAPGLATDRRAELLARAGHALDPRRHPELWARVAEAQLADAAELVPERADALRRELAHVCAEQLGRPDRALVHLRALVDASESVAEADRRALLGLLRVHGDSVELARRLAESLREHPDDAAAWRELAHLREEKLAGPAAAAAAWRELARLEPGAHEAWAGLRRCAERCGDWRELVRALEAELALGVDSPAAHWRRIGAVRWRKLGDVTAAERALAAARTLEPADLSALRLLQEIAEGAGDAARALALYDEERARLGEGDRERAREVWLRVAALAGETTHEPERAAVAFERADAIAPLGADELAAWAKTLERSDATRPWCEVFARWCEHPAARPEAGDWIALAEGLARCGRGDESVAALDRALSLAPDRADAWRLEAEVHEQAGRASDAIECWQRAAACSKGDASARAHARAAALLEADEPEAACACLEGAVAAAPDFAPAHAALAHVAERLGRAALAVESASRSVDLAGAGVEAPAELRLRAALAGARSARMLGRWRAAFDLGAAALAFDGGAPDALAAHGIAALELGALEACRRDLEARLALDAPDPDPAALRIALARALEALSDPDGALLRYGEALALDPERDEAHGGRVGLLERLGRRGEAAHGIAEWAARTRDPALRAERYVRAARLARLASGFGADSEAWLRAALDAVAGHAGAWLELVEGLWDCGRQEAALASAVEGVERVACGRVRATLYTIQGRALEAGERGEEALAAHRSAVASDPGARESARAAARLLRLRGEWREAAEMLGHAAEGHGEEASRAQASFEMAQLLAGPLEDLDAALAAYDRACALAPQRLDVREARARLLAELPGRAAEAAAEFAAVLTADAARIEAVRKLVRLARAQGDATTAGRGLAILGALGAASPLEREEAPARLDFAAAASQLEDPVGERLRVVLAKTIRRSSATPGGAAVAEGPPATEAATRIRHAFREAERAVLGAGVLTLPPEPLAAAAQQIVREAREGHLGRTGVRAARELDGISLAGFDWAAWRHALRALAWARALDSTGGDLRAVLTVLLEDAGALGDTSLPLAPEVDLAPWIGACPEARALLARVIRAWTQTRAHPEAAGGPCGDEGAESAS